MNTMVIRGVGQKALDILREMARKHPGRTLKEIMRTHRMFSVK